MSNKPILLLMRQIPPPIIGLLEEHFEVRFESPGYLERRLNPDIYADVNIIMTTPFEAMPSTYLEQLPESVGLIANIGVGYDHIDIKTASNRDFLVSNTPGAMNDEVANLTLMFILNLFRKIRGNDEWVRSQNWGRSSNSSLIGTSLAGKKLGLIGYGGIAQEVARRAVAFKMEVAYYKPNPLVNNEDNGVLYQCNLDQLISDSDVVSLHCPLFEETTHLINEQRLKSMKKTAIIVNTGRGALIDESALVEALKNKTIAGAGLDVFEQEPEVHPELLSLDNVVLTPHIGSATTECHQQMFQMALNNVFQFLKKGKVINQV